MYNIVNQIKSELNIGRNAWIFLAFGLLLQIVSYLISNDSALSFTSGILGVFAVVLCSQRKAISYFFGILQLVTFIVLSWQTGLYAKIAENIFYLITMFIGIFIWKTNYTDEQVQTTKLSRTTLGWIILLMPVVIIILGYILTLTDDKEPYLDAATTVPAFVAQILMILRYREQWIFWFTIDVWCIILWACIGNYCMVAQYVFWTINCIYGWIKWK